MTFLILIENTIFMVTFLSYSTYFLYHRVLCKYGFSFSILITIGYNKNIRQVDIAGIDNLVPKRVVWLPELIIENTKIGEITQRWTKMVGYRLFS